jgi:hypothetical protein
MSEILHTQKAPNLSPLLVEALSVRYSKRILPETKITKGK